MSAYARSLVLAPTHPRSMGAPRPLAAWLPLGVFRYKIIAALSLRKMSPFERGGESGDVKTMARPFGGTGFASHTY